MKILKEHGVYPLIPSNMQSLEEVNARHALSALREVYSALLKLLYPMNMTHTSSIIGIATEIYFQKEYVKVGIYMAFIH
jgi:hypothetical protein